MNALSVDTIVETYKKDITKDTLNKAIYKGLDLEWEQCIKLIRLLKDINEELFKQASTMDSWRPLWSKIGSNIIANQGDKNN